MKFKDAIKKLEIYNYKDILKSYNNLFYGFDDNNIDSPLHQEILSIISDFAWEMLNLDDTSKTERLNILFELYEDIPSYYVIAQILHNVDILEEEGSSSRLFLWEKMYQYLSYSDNRHSKNIEYTLDVDYFEDERFVYEVWRYFMSKNFNDNFLRRMLSASGSVDYELKANLYSRLIADKKYHPYIFNSLYESKFHGFKFTSQMDDVEGKKVLEQLTLDLENDSKLKEEYDKLYKAL